MSLPKKVKRLVSLGIALAIAIPVLVLGYRGYADLTIRIDYNYLFGERSAPEPSEFTAISVSGASVPGMKAAAESDALVLFINEGTTAIAVYDKRNGSVWYSVPPGANADELANNYQKEYMASSIWLEYFNPGRQLLSKMSYTDSVAHEQFTLYSIPGGVRIVYLIGEAPSLLSKLPVYITEQRLLEAVLERIDGSEARAIRRYYIESPEMPGYLQISPATMRNKPQLQRIYDAFEAAGYTEDDLRMDNAAVGAEYEDDTVNFITVPVNFTLNGDKLVVGIDASEIEESDSMQLYRMELLKFFGAATSEEEGYLFIPSGSGALIDFDNGKSAYESYSQRVYGHDLLEAFIILQQSEAIRLPVFGIKKQEGAMLAYVSKGAGAAFINADVAGKLNSYNVAFPSFTFRSWDEVTVMTDDYNASSRAFMTIVQKEKYTGPIEMTYCFLPGADDGYAEMAGYYRRLLQDEGSLPRDTVNDGAKAPFYVDILGSIEREQSYAGVPVYASVPMTTAAQAGEIASALTAGGVRNIQMRYLGWFNGGINHWAPKSIKPQNNIGGVKALQTLYEDIQSFGGSLFLDTTFSFSPERKKNYSVPKEAARFLGGFAAFHAYERNRVTLRRGSFYWENFGYINSPRIIPDYVDSFLKKYGEWGFDTLSVRDMGDMLTSDANQRYNLSREHTRIIYERELEKISERYASILINGGSQYALRHASGVTGSPVSASMFYIFDREVPFYQMVLHGLIPYAGAPVNISDNIDGEYELKMAEYGAAPYFIWSYQPTSEMRWTGYNRYYSTEYTTWLDGAVEMYKRLSAVSEQVRGARMTGHIVHDNGIHETRYDNQISVYVNYGYEQADMHGNSVPARGYTAGRSGQ